MVLLGTALRCCWRCISSVAYTIITFGSFYSVLDVAGPFSVRTVYYLAESVIFASIICAVLIAMEKPIVKKIFIGFVLAVFTGSEVIRMFDWGALFFSGMHINNNFWAHAFYTNRLVFLVAKESNRTLCRLLILFFRGDVPDIEKDVCIYLPGEVIREKEACCHHCHRRTASSPCASGRLCTRW